LPPSSLEPFNFSDRGSQDSRERSKAGHLPEPPPDRPRRLQPQGPEAALRPAKQDQDGQVSIL